MSDTVHKLYIGVLVFIVTGVFIYLTYTGFSYYNSPFEERFYHEDHTALKPSGIFGHGLGIIGSTLLTIGVFGYMARKRYRFLAKFGRLKYWLEFHIFLATLGPIMILFHTAFKFGGIVAISFWSMVAVFLSGIAGRFIYLQIPRTIEGRELSLNEIRNMKEDMDEVLQNSKTLDEESRNLIINITTRRNTASGGFFSGLVKNYLEDKKSIGEAKRILRAKSIPADERKNIIQIIKNETSLNRKIERLTTMQNLFKYWHVVHLPFALVMLIIMIIHIIVAITFGYTWIF
ncbi:MAG: hypothetical protein KDC05_01110 [Bacteroidales bacterium]|nr:hypothetical protein [Bacteroidales bacterium]